MKVCMSKFYSIAVGLAYLFALPANAGFDLTNIAGYARNKTFFFNYVCSKLLDNSVAAVEKPFEMPAQADMPTPIDLAQGIAESIGPDHFLRGASTSEHQCSKLCTPEICSWSRFAQERNLPTPHDSRYQIDWWKHYKSYIDYAKEHLKLNALRFSIEWPLVQPQGPDLYDENVLNHYADLFVYAIKQGITPMVCFHHYTDPNWFLDRGGFEKDENIEYFSAYCTKVYEKIMSAVLKNRGAIKAIKDMTPRQPMWATFNAPDGYAFRGYRQHQGPPADPKRAGLGIVAQVLKNTLRAHAQVYHKIKTSYQNSDAAYYIKSPRIGILKNIHQLDPAQETWGQYLAAPLTRFVCSVADMIQNGSVYQFFKTGEFRVHVPFLIDMQYNDPEAVGTLDFIGLNHYSNRYMFLSKSIKPTDPDVCSDNVMYYRYPQGMYRAIVEISEKMARPLDIPVIVAENGIATQDNDKRYRFYHEYMYAIHRAIQDGYPVQGYLPWTLATNYEWPSTNPEENTHRDYGICTVDPENPERLIVKEGSRSYVQFSQHLASLENQKRVVRKKQLVR